jgi:two-component system response regulator NreC
MSLWQRLQKWLGRQVLPFDQTILDQLQNLAEQEQRPKELVAADLLSMALVQRGAAETNLQRWRELSPREQQVATLVCLNYTNRQIAARLHISPETVKTHVRNTLYKFGLRTKAELHQALADWDFNAWQEG